MSRNIVAALDIGTTKVGCVIAEKVDKKLIVIGAGVVQSDGMSRGLITNIVKVTNAISEAVQIASKEADINVPPLNIGISGEHIQTIRHHGYVTIESEDNEIKQPDVDKLESEVRKLQNSANLEILHIIPEKYIIDGNDDISDPVGMIGKKLEADNNVVMASISAIANLERAVQRAGYSVKSKVLQSLASSYSVLTAEEKQLGVLLIDIGGGTTDIAIFHDGRMKFNGIIGKAGLEITKSISDTFNILEKDAEIIKIDFGFASQKSIVTNYEVTIRNDGGNNSQKTDVSTISQIISPAISNLFRYIDIKLDQHKMKKYVRTGIVITGGGSKMRGIIDFAKEIFGKNVRLGIPRNIESRVAINILHPEYSTLLGLIQNVPAFSIEAKVEPKEIKKNTAVKNILDKIIQIFSEL